VNIFRRLPLNRLLLLWGAVIAIGVSATALASALDSGPVAPAKPLAQAVHDALSGTSAQQVEGVSARIQLTNHLLEGANLASGGQFGELASSPLIAGASGRLWIAKDGDVRLELQAEKGDTEIIYDGHTLSLYDAATNTLYRYTPPADRPSHGAAATTQSGSQAPSVEQVETAISRLSRHASVTSTATDVAGQPAYTVHLTPKESGSLLGGAELSFDANNGAPLRAAIYSSSDSSSPVIELAATEVSYGPVADSVFAFTAPASAKVEQVSSTDLGHKDTRGQAHDATAKPKLTSSGHGLATVGVLETKTSASAGGSSDPLEELPQVDIDGTKASELRTELGTLLTFERSGVRYLLAGSVTPSAIEDLARGL
jgi:outer membrane lipoprotein-sorting protein